MKSFNGGICAVVLCAGRGERTGLGYNKILHYVGKKTVLELTLDAFTESMADNVILVVNPADRTDIHELAANYKNVRSVDGGDTRTESVRRGLAAAEGADIVCIHDCARPYVSPALINATIESARKFGSGIAAVKTTDTIKKADGLDITESVPRENLWNMQTPQTFEYNRIREAYKKISGNYTDDSEVYALAGFTPKIVEGEYSNVKITTQSDLFKSAPARTRIGTGFDVHEFTEGRPLILGGVTIPHKKGLKGHSDADVLIHAIADALLSAAGLPDIGVLFPDTDPDTEGICSLILLKDVMSRLNAGGFRIASVSAVIMAQKPKLSGHIAAMRQTLADAVDIDVRQINISATTTEHLGIIGEEKGIAASAVCLIEY